MSEGSDNDLSKLSAFLIESERILINLIAEPEGLLLKRVSNNKKLRESLEDAWEDVGKNIQTVVQKLHDALDQENIIVQLEKVGLTGKQLQFKLDLFYWLKDRWQTKRTRNWAVRILGVMNTILGSMAKVFAQIEPVKEFKEAIEQIVRMK